MRISKAILIIFSCLFLSFATFIPKKLAHAETENYARVLSSEVFIYQDANFQEPLFIIPFGYYLKIEQVNNSSVKVSYGNGNYPTIFGYAKKSELTFVDYVPKTPFGVIKVSTDINDVLFNDFELSHPYFNVPKNEILFCYGEVDSGDLILSYVYYNKKLGYIDKASLNPYTITNNPDPLPSDEEETPNEEETLKPIVSSSLGERLQIVIIVAISIVTISVVYFLFKPTKNRTEEEQNEFF